jgi:hypothetical protein
MNIDKLINKAYKEDDGSYYLSDDAVRKFMKGVLRKETKEELEKDMFDFWWQIELVKKYICRVTEKRERLNKKQVHKLWEMLSFRDRNIED